MQPGPAVPFFLSLADHMTYFQRIFSLFGFYVIFLFILMKLTTPPPFQRHHQASTHLPLSQSTSPFNIMWPAYTNQLTCSKHGHQPIGSWACLSQAPSPPPTLTWSAKPTTPHLLPINGSYAPPQMSTWQHILSSPHLTDIFSHYCIAVNI